MPGEVITNSVLDGRRSSTDALKVNRGKIRHRGALASDPSRVSWANRGLTGTFPCPVTVLFSLLLEIDVSRNGIVHLDCHVILANAPSLRKFCLAENLITRLGVIVPLGAFAELQDLDIRENPCVPAGGRGALLAALLLPHLSQAPSVAAAAKSACTSLSPAAKTGAGSARHLSAHKTPEGGRGATTICQEPLLFGSQSTSALSPLMLQSPNQNRGYRSQHLARSSVGTQNEVRNRQCLTDFRAMSRPGSAPARQRHPVASAFQRQVDSPQSHMSDLQRPVQFCLPRAHQYQVPVGDSSHGGAGWASPEAAAWFPRLVRLNGECITVQELEDAADEVAHLAIEAEGRIRLKSRPGAVAHKSNEDGGCQQLRRKHGEDYNSLLVRIRSELLRRRDRIGKMQSAHTAFYSETFERWRKRSDGEQQSDDEDYQCEAAMVDYDLQSGRLVSRVGRTLSAISKANVGLKKCREARDQRESEENKEMFAEMENTMWLEQREKLWLLEQGGVDSSTEPASDSDTYDFVEDPEVAMLKELRRRALAQRAGSAPAPSKQVAKKRPRPRRGEIELRLARVRILRQKDIDFQKTKALRDAIVGSSVHGSGDDNEDADPSQDPVTAGAIMRLRDMFPGAISSSKNEMTTPLKIARQQWLQQLHEDYPSEFCKVSVLGEQLLSPYADVDDDQQRIMPESRSKALLDSQLWMLNLHGDPLDERDWQCKGVWLSNTGRLWSESPTDADARPVRHLGGASVRDVQVSIVSSSQAIVSIDKREVFVFKIDLPGARFSRMKYLAALDTETRDRWVRICTAM